MKIVHFQAYFQPQLGYQEYFLCKSMVKLGHEVHMITSNKYNPVMTKTPEMLKMLGGNSNNKTFEKIDGFIVHRLKIIFEIRGRVVLKGIYDLLNTIKPDFVLLHGTTNFLNISPFFYRKIFKYKIIADDHQIPSMSPNNFISKTFFLIWGIYIKYLMRKNHLKLVGVADICCEFLSDVYKINIEDIYNIPLGADIDLFKPNISQRNIIRQKFGYKKSDIIIIYTGRINYEKNPLILLESCNDLIDKLPLKFIFIGSIDPRYENEFKNKSSRFELKYIKSVLNKDLPKYYNASDIACWPKHTSLSAFEAASCGLPIIISKNVKERVEYGNGICIEEENHKDISSAIEKLSLNSSLRKEMGKKGRALVKDKFSYDIIAKQFLELYSDW